MMVCASCDGTGWDGDMCVICSGVGWIDDEEKES